MQYTSTRNKALSFSAGQCLLQGISAEGGLFVPQSLPPFAPGLFKALQKETYAKRAQAVLAPFFTDFSAEELAYCTRMAYGPQFDSPAVAPVKQVNETAFSLELWHGPTLAFKDMALQVLPHLMRVAKENNRQSEDILILVATSGDTGKAALEGFAGVPGMRIAVYYPSEGVSPLQKLQMITQDGDNVAVFGVKGNFDDAQSSVKQMFADPAINEILKARSLRFSSANSINWGRLAPQIVYYVSAYADMLAAGHIAEGEKINIVVPTGNFGNILAAYYAKQMGLPVHMLICASNHNNVLTDFMQTGAYNRNRPFHKTISPSMDILISSNLERLLFELTGRSDAAVCAMMKDLQEKGLYQLPETALSALKEGFWGGYATEEQTLAAISQTYKESGYITDPHTAVAFSVYNDYKAATQDSHKTLIASTASPYKFAGDVIRALTGKMEEERAALSALEKHLPMPLSVTRLFSRPILHREVLEKTQMANALLEFAGK